LFLLLLVLRCFTSQGALFYHKDKSCRGLLDRVSPFGNLRIKDCFTSPRSLSQQRHVLHRFLKSRHPPYALKFPVKKFENHKPHIAVGRIKPKIKQNILSRTAPILEYFFGFFLSGREKTLNITRQKFNFQFSFRPDFSTKKPPFGRPTDKRKSAYICRLLKLFLVIFILIERV
jgi:hypothetical protein